MTTLYQVEQRQGEVITLYQVEHTGQYVPLPEFQPQRGELDEDLITQTWNPEGINEGRDVDDDGGAWWW